MNSHLNLPFDLRSHLTESQIDDHLIGDLAAAPAAHLAACPVCAERIAAAADPLTSFQSVSMAWSERRSAALPIPDLSLQRPLWQRPIVSFAVCFVFVLGIALTNATQQFPMRSAAPQPVSVETSDPVLQQQAVVVHPPAPVETAHSAVQRVAQLSADNHMLRAIGAELDASTDSAAELGIVSAGEVAAHPSGIASVQD